MPDELGAIADLYKQYAPTLYRRCRSLLGDEDQARDMVQEAFIRYMNANYKKGSAFALLYRIATNLCIDKLRGRVRHEHESSEDHPLESDLDTGSRVESAMDLAILTRGIKEQHLEVAVLYHVDGYTHEEVAKSLGLSRRSVGKHLSSVQEHMQQRAARLGFTPGKKAAPG